ncbi:MULTISPECIES: autotransporter [unclassified Microcoleus]|uniref:autotransporter n=1 Tax=unclassified Microcoleus TaxID=2642155 RepID=UPI002FD71EEA
MRLQKIKLLTGATLSVLMSAVSVHPVMANPATQIAQTQTTTTANTQTLTGFVKSIVGDVVTIRPENSRYRTLRIQKCVLKIIGLVPGMKVRVLLAGDMVQNIAVIPDYKVVATTVVRPAAVAPRPAPEPPPMLPAPAPRPITRPAPAPMPAPRPIPAPRPAPVRGLW